MLAACGHDVPDKNIKYCQECGKKVIFIAPANPADYAIINFIPKIAFSPEEAAEVIGISVSFVRKLCAEKKLKHGRFGARIVIRLEALEELCKLAEAENMRMPNAILQQAK